MNIKFCPNCHREVKLPEFMTNGKMKITGDIRIGCSHCHKGVIIIKGTKKNENKQS